MKKLLTIAFTLISFGNIHAQVTQDNNMPTSGAFIGWDGPAPSVLEPLTIKTNNQARMTIDDLGNISIGAPPISLTSPLPAYRKLHVNIPGLVSNSYLNSETHFYATVDDAPGSFFAISNLTNLPGRYIPAFNGHNALDNNQAQFFVASTDNTGGLIAGTNPLMTFDSRILIPGTPPTGVPVETVAMRSLFNWRSAGSEYMRMIYNGSVGIGTSTPASLLHLNTSNLNNGEALRSDCTPTENPHWRMLRNGNEIGALYNDNTADNVFRFRATNAGATGGMRFYVGTGTSNEKLRITTMGDDRIFAFYNGSTSILNPSNPAKFEINDRNPGQVNAETITGLRVRVRGFNHPDGPPGNPATNLTLAEFIQNRQMNADGGIRIQGSREDAPNADVAFIDLSNFDWDNSQTTYTMARITGGMGPAAQPLAGNLKFYTNPGGGLQERVRITPLGDVGINTTNPQNKLEINSDDPSDVPGNSGLRLTDLTSNSTLMTNPGPGVLSVDTDGDVIYVPGGSGAFTMDCVSPFDLTTDQGRVNLNGHNFYFIGDGGSVGIGQGDCVTLNAKLDVDQASGTPGSRGLDVRNSDNNSRAIVARAPGPGGIGVESKARRIAGRFTAVGPSPGAITGVWGIVSGAGASNCAVRGDAPSGANNWAACFNGKGYITSGMWFPSDRKLKNNIEEIEGAIDILGKISPKTYYYDDSGFPSINLPTRKQYGLIAQELEEVLPDLVRDIHHPAVLDSLGNTIHEGQDLKGLSYTPLIALLIQGHKEQQALIEKLQEQIADGAGTSIGAQNQNTVPTIDVVLESTPVLYQNSPNPFSSSTSISYFLPRGTTDAMIVFQDQYGKVMKKVALTEHGHGSINVDAADLSNGVYAYSMVIDGVIIDSKKMVKTE